MLTARAIDLPEATQHQVCVTAPAEFPFQVSDKLFALAEDLGVSRDALLQSAGVPERSGLTYAQLCALYEQAARLTGDSVFGLHVGERTAPGSYGLLGYAAANSPTLGESVERLTALQSIWSSAAGLELRRGPRTFVLGYWHRGEVPVEVRRHESEQMLAAILAFVRVALAEPVRPAEVRFEHGAPADLSEHARLFAAPILFGAPATEIVFAETLLDRPLAAADLALGALIHEQAELTLAAQVRTDSFDERLRAALRDAIARGAPLTLDQAAMALQVGSRSLQRRLAASSIRFRTLCDELRIEQAGKLLLDDTLSLAEIAHRLGFSQPSAFHRAFRRASGTTPRQFRFVVRTRGSV